MGKKNTVVSAYTLYRHLQQYCSHPSVYSAVIGRSFIHSDCDRQHEIGGKKQHKITDACWMDMSVR